MTVDRLVRMFAGAVVLISLALGVAGSPLFVSQWSLAVTAFVGFNLFQSSFTNLPRQRAGQTGKLNAGPHQGDQHADDSEDACDGSRGKANQVHARRPDDDRSHQAKTSVD